jgi:hypothetical protein
MAKYRKKPVVIEAIKFTGWNSTEIEAWMIGRLARDKFGIRDAGHIVEIHTLEGVMDALPMDYIICGVKGEFYPCKPDIFDLTYEEVSE